MPLDGQRLKFERLPEIAKPLHYTLFIAPDLNKFSFEGHVDIDVEVVSATDVLKMHAQRLSISKVVVKMDDGTSTHQLHPLLQFQCDEDRNMLTVQLPYVIHPQKIRLSIDFLGKLNDKMNGFYLSSYKNEYGEKKFMAATQFDSTYARTAFPCWDEPIYKATFEVRLVVPSAWTALSNMVDSEVFCSEERKMVFFKCSPPMSTYLLAFVIGELEYLEEKTEGGVTIRVYTLFGKKQQGAFGLELAKRAIEWYSDWFNIDYPLPKCDLVTIPDCSWCRCFYTRMTESIITAMENWGLVTYREVSLLIDSVKSSAIQKVNVALTVAHEMAHLWFGDLVTMKWWTDLWLKEGFASYMSFLFIGYNYPEYNIWLQFLNDELSVGLRLDALRSSHPIEVEINNPNELTEIFDSITYAKSNCVIRMLCYYLGETTFQKGLRLYLKKYQFGNAVTQDLWDALSEASGKDINALMSSWTTQMGFPLISVEQRQEGHHRILNLKQRRFIADGGDDDDEPTWQVRRVHFSLYTTQDDRKESSGSELSIRKLVELNDTVIFQRCIQSVTNMYCSEEVAQDVEVK
uniref:Peptidase_M1 domain-containing protein n=1 Tax=Heterorhabditis bacteriophora TaxID=37862 RepID=A0A1I7XH35_HETBA